MVIDKKFGAPSVTKDGVSVAKEIELKPRGEHGRPNGEGGRARPPTWPVRPTTATVLAQVQGEGFRNVAAGANPMDLKGTDKVAEAIVSGLRELSREVGSDSKIVGTISANNDKTIGSLIAEAMKVVGNEGVTVEEAKGTETEVKTEGMQFDRGYLSLLRDQPRQDGGGAREPLHLDPRQEDLQHEGPLARARANGTGRSSVVDHRRRRRRGVTLVVNKIRGALKVAAVKPLIWRPSQGYAPGHRHPHRRSGDFEETGLSWRTPPLPIWARRRKSPSTRTTPPG